MKNMDAKTRIQVTSIVFFLITLTIGISFYFVVAAYITDSTKTQMEFAANQIIERLSGEFLLVERLSSDLINSSDVKSLVKARTPHRQYRIFKRIQTMLGTGAYNSSFIEHVVVFGSQSHYIRLTGKLGNKSCAQLFDVLTALNLPKHLEVYLDGQKYLGYADAISPNTPEAAVILTQEEKILEILRTYDQNGSLLVAIQAGGKIVASNTANTAVFTAAASDYPVIHSRLGITPYEITVAANERYMNASIMYFTVVAAISVFLFGMVLFIYAGILNRRFFSPMVKVIGNIENLNTDSATETLPSVQSQEFDRLIDKINAMLLKLAKKNTEVKNAELRAKNSEIEHQKALIFSLKKQINAHFIINTLNTIRLLGEHGEQEKAESIALGLTSLVRYAHAKDELINIWAELEILKKYITIMNSRYDAKITVEFDFDDRLMEYSMPRMLLQPILENAIAHGFEDMDSGCKICVKAALCGNGISFLISDNGRGMSEAELAALNMKLNNAPQMSQGYENIALLNIKNRLYHYYGNEGQIQILGDTGGLEVAISILPAIKTGGSYD